LPAIAVMGDEWKRPGVETCSKEARDGSEVLSAEEKAASQASDQIGNMKATMRSYTKELVDSIVNFE